MKAITRKAIETITWCVAGLVIGVLVSPQQTRKWACVAGVLTAVVLLSLRYAKTGRWTH